MRPSKHDHVNSMVFEDDRCYCSECGQTWMMRRDVDKMGKVKCRWVVAGSGY